VQKLVGLPNSRQISIDSHPGKILLFATIVASRLKFAVIFV
jgi:hypothetical protein